MDRNRPRIGITAYDVPASFSQWSDMQCVMVPSGYTRATAAAGGIPLLLPPIGGMTEVLDDLDGLVLSGGSDIAADRYGQEPHPQTLGVFPHRDEAELELLAEALERRIPVLGICRGMQLLNVLRGGSLHQHLPDVVADGALHKATPGIFARHAVELEAGSRLAGLIDPAAQVHSCHHQAPDRIGDGLVVTARAADGVVEGIELESEGFAIGVLWHPEEDAEGGGSLFQEVVEQARVRPGEALASPS
ncbi:MAG: putative glutamine amidotransferase [Gaiellales bacterium]|jgi:anthranilate synthase component 2/putative glutamine amidotransferase|nr:putative glutamine amidotransferase [Gaiellales bacterium]